MRARGMAVERTPQSGAVHLGRPGARALTSLLLTLLLTLLLLTLLLLTACGTSTPAIPSSPSGMYTNAAFQFSVTYPSGWIPNEIQAPLGSPQATPSAAVAIPLTVVIAQIDTAQIDSALLSSFTITVLNTSDAAIASSIAAQRTQASGANPTLTTVTLASQSAWQAQPVTQPLPDSGKSSTHTDYYLLHGAYEYQLSTDSITGGGADAALATMLKSFAFTA